MDTQNENPTTLKEVVEEDIFKLLGAESFSAEEKEKLYEKMMETIRFRVFERFDEALKEDERETFKKILYEGSDDDLKTFYLSRNFDFDQIMVEEALKYKIELTTYIELIKKSGATLDELKNKIKKDQL